MFGITKKVESGKPKGKSMWWRQSMRKDRVALASVLAAEMGLSRADLIDLMVAPMLISLRDMDELDRSMWLGEVTSGRMRAEKRFTSCEDGGSVQTV